MTILLMHQLASSLFTLYYLVGYFNKISPVVLHSADQYMDKSNGENIANYTFLKTNRDKGIDSLRFIAVSSIFLFLLFIVIYSLPNYANCVIQEVLSTGIHIPILLGAAGFLLSKYKPQLDNEEKRNTFLVVSIALNVDCIAFNWKIALFVLSIILGKYIWIDFVFDSQFVFQTLKSFLNSDNVCDTLIKTYGIHSVCLFYVMTIIYSIIHSFIKHIPPGHTLLTILICFYVVVFMGYMNFVSCFNPKESDK